MPLLSSMQIIIVSIEYSNNNKRWCCHHGQPNSIKTSISGVLSDVRIGETQWEVCELRKRNCLSIFGDSNSRLQSGSLKSRNQKKTKINTEQRIHTSQKQQQIYTSNCLVVFGANTSMKFPSMHTPFCKFLYSMSSFVLKM